MDQATPAAETQAHVPPNLLQRGIDTAKGSWLIAAAALLVMAAPFLFTNGFWIFFFSSIGVTIILVSSLNLALGYVGLVSITQTGLYGIGAYTTAILAQELGWNFWVTLPLAVLAAAAAGALISLTTVRLSNLYFAIVTLAFNTIIVEIIREGGDLTGGEIGLFGLERPSLFGVEFNDTIYYYFVWFGVAFTLWSMRNLVDRSKYGRIFRALKGNEDAAVALGISPLRYRLLAFTLSAGLAGGAGVLFAHLNAFISPQIAGLEGGLILFVALLLGGSGTLLGPVLGVLFIAFITEQISDYARFQQLIFGGVLLLTVFLIPKGIVGTINAFFERRRNRKLHLSEDNADSDGSTLDASVDYLDPQMIHDLLDIPNRRKKTDSPLLAATNIRKSFGGLQALAGVDLTVQAGTIHGLIGPNGSGKSTLINCLTSYLPRDTGDVIYDGEPTPDTAYDVASRGIVRVFQIPHLFGDMTVKENILVGLHSRAHHDPISYLLGMPYARREDDNLCDIASQLLHLAGLNDKADVKARLLPHGQQRLLEVLRALVASPRLLILDEPATGLVTSEVKALGYLLQKLRDSGVTILLIEHNMAFVMQICDIVTVLEEGEKIAEGLPDDVQNNPRVIEAYLGEPERIGELKKAMKATVDKYA